MLWFCSVRWKSASKISSGMGSPDAAEQARILPVEIDVRDSPTLVACAGACGPAIEEISICIWSFGIPDQAGRDLHRAGELPAPVPPARQISRCSESRIK